MDSILLSVKASLGIVEEYTHFDPQIIMHINAVFMILQQLGLGDAREAFSITDGSETWTDYLATFDFPSPSLNLVQSYMYLKVRLLFDPPTNSFLVESMNKQIQEFEWRLNVAVDPIV